MIKLASTITKIIQNFYYLKEMIMKNEHTHSLMNGKSAYIRPVTDVCILNGAYSVMVFSNNLGLDTTDEYIDPSQGW